MERRKPLPFRRLTAVEKASIMHGYKGCCDDLKLQNMPAPSLRVFMKLVVPTWNLLDKLRGLQ